VGDPPYSIQKANMRRSEVMDGVPVLLRLSARVKRSARARNRCRAGAPIMRIAVGLENMAARFNIGRTSVKRHDGKPEPCEDDQHHRE
jgi:hypothetical protein